MPRNGDESSDNGPIEGTTIAHGAPDSNTKITDHVDRADKTAPMPEGEKGEGLQDVNASGGQSQGLRKGDNVGQGGSN